MKRFPSVVLLLCGCASAAPPLPPDTTGTSSLHPVSASDFSANDLALTCARIAEERRGLTGQMEQADVHIAENRERNQVAGYIGATVMPLAYLATEGNYAEKETVRTAYARQDVLMKLSVYKHCR